MLDNRTGFVNFFTSFCNSDNNNDFRGPAMVWKCLPFSLLLGVTLLNPSVGNSQTNDTAKVSSPPDAHMMVPSHTPTDSVTIPAGPDTDTIFGPNDWMVVETHHRMYPAFRQVDTVKPRQRFQLGDDGPFAEVVKFVADLKVSMKGEKMKMSDTLFNPAVLLKVLIPDSVTHKDSLVQETWAFYFSGAPHFSRHAFFAFKLLDFKVENPKYVKPPEGK